MTPTRTNQPPRPDQPLGAGRGPASSDQPACSGRPGGRMLAGSGFRRTVLAPVVFFAAVLATVAAVLRHWWQLAAVGGVAPFALLLHWATAAAAWRRPGEGHPVVRRVARGVLAAAIVVLAAVCVLALAAPQTLGLRPGGPR